MNGGCELNMTHPPSSVHGIRTLLLYYFTLLGREEKNSGCFFVVDGGRGVRESHRADHGRQTLGATLSVAPRYIFRIHVGFAHLLDFL